MRRVVLIAALLALVAGLPSPARAGAGAVLVKGGLSFPTAFAFTPNGTRIFYVERFSGEVRVLNLATGDDRLFYTVTSVVSDGERGMLGITIHPEYPIQPYVYLYATRTVNGAAKNQLIRLTNQGGNGTGFVALMTSNSISGYHNGGAIRVGPDRRLYALVGDGHSSANAQNTGNNLGKALRMNLSGRPVAGNPFGNRIFSFGHRNMFGLAFDPQGGGLWLTENGPACNDEVNFIVLGGNYAWGPNQTCGGAAPGNTNQDGPAPRRLPEVFYVTTIAPTGAEFCDGCGLAGQEGHLLFGANNDGRVRSLTLDAGRDDVTSQAVIYDHPGPIISMVAAPDGRVYFSDTGGIWRLTP